jgi:hypothetical protein
MLGIQKKYLAIRNNQRLRKRISYMRVSRRRTRLLQYLFTIFVLVHFGSIWHASSSTTGACHSTGKSRTSQHDATSTARRSKCDDAKLSFTPSRPSTYSSSINILSDDIPERWKVSILFSWPPNNIFSSRHFLIVSFFVCAKQAASRGRSH